MITEKLKGKRRIDFQIMLFSIVRNSQTVKYSQNIEKSVLKALAGCNIMERCPLCCQTVRAIGDNRWICLKKTSIA